MLVRHISRQHYAGLERRSSLQRRVGKERRNLVRFDSLGSDRRQGLYRRREDLQWNSV